MLQESSEKAKASGMDELSLLARLIKAPVSQSSNNFRLNLFGNEASSAVQRENPRLGHYSSLDCLLSHALNFVLKSSSCWHIHHEQRLHKENQKKIDLSDNPDIYRVLDAHSELSPCRNELLACKGIKYTKAINQRHGSHASSGGSNRCQNFKYILFRGLQVAAGHMQEYTYFLPALETILSGLQGRL